MALTLYGSPRSRTLRVLWTLAELGLDYDLAPLEWDDPHLKSPDFLALNPAGAIPTLVDGEVALCESMAINLYLAARYGAGVLYPTDLADQAQVWRWSLFAQGHIEPFVQRDAHLLAVRDKAAGEWEAGLRRSLETLERHLDGREWLVGEAFSVADLNAAGVLSPSRARTAPMGDYPAVSAWLARCYARPAATATRARYG